MYNKLLYVTITNESKDEALVKIKREVGHLKLAAWGFPISLGANAKILVLYESNRDRLIKIDGPGFIIIELYEYFK